MYTKIRGHRVSRAVLASALITPVLAISLSSFQTANAQEEADPKRLNPVIVTAQKREQSVNDVGMSITTADADFLADKQVTSPEDLIRIVPGLTYTVSQFDFPTYTLRGVGFYDSGLTSSPAVSVYVDQVALPYPAMTRGAMLDLERVEVLKGPQGTLFGQNSTGGAINYVSAKPTEELAYGGHVSYGRFDTFEGEGYLSGPISDKLGYRLSGKVQDSGPWQESASRPGDELGKKEFATGRLLIDFAPSDDLSFLLNINGWSDKSDTLAPQVVEIVPVVPGLPLPGSVVAIPTGDARLADWTPGVDLSRDNSFFQVSLRGEWSLSDNLSIVSVTSSQKYDQYAYNDGDGTPAFNLHTVPTGDVESFSQELRLEGQSLDDRLIWLVGANYQDDSAHDNQIILLGESTGAVTPFGSFEGVINDARTDITNTAIFANAEYALSDMVSVNAGIRYTETSFDYDACSLDSGAGDLTSIFAAIQTFALGVPVTVTPGGCVTLRDDTNATPQTLFTTERFEDSLDENNVSWRLGANLKPFSNDTLLYATVSQGYKSGSFPVLSAQLASQLSPATQEKLVAYEVGVKAPLENLGLQLNAAAFYYDYTDKQLRGRIQTFFGQLEKLVNIPESTIKGAEVQALWTPTEHLTMSAGATYIDSEIGDNADGTPYLAFPQRTHGMVPVSGQAFPFTPEWSITADAEYRWNVSSKLEGFVGTGLTYQSRTKSGLESADPSRPQAVSDADVATYNDRGLIIPEYTLIDLRLGIADVDGKWDVSVWGKNITDEYYLLNAIKTQDTLLNYPGSPMTFGVSLSLRH